MRRWVLAFLAIMAPLAGAAQELVPDKRLVLTRNVDFYGSDLQSVFDTTLEACQRVCLNDAQCRAFTFNTRSNACFPKSDISDRQPYEGAVSARVILTDGHTRTRAAERAGDLGFLRGADFARALTEASEVGPRHSGGEWTVAALRDAARQQEASGALRNALFWTGAAVAQSDAPGDWLDYARLNRSYAESLARSDQRRYLDRSVLAAINAYLRAAGGDARVDALHEMARALEAVGRGRAMIPALRLAERIRPRPEITALLDEAVGKYGFRIVGHVVEADSADPRICAEFSEDLRQSGFDYTPFLQLPTPTLAVEASERRICVSGVEHGERYRVVFRSGLPSADGETLMRDVPLRLYVRDRSASVRFPGRGYVLPRVAEAGIPILSVNLDEVDLVLRRVSDRNLIRTMQDNLFGRPLSQYEERLFANEIAEEIWRGRGVLQNRLNADMTTRLPVGEIVGELRPGVYALSAALPDADPYDDPTATQWFVLSDIGLTSLSGVDGLHVVARGLTDAAPLEGLELLLVSRSNRVLGQTVSDAQGVARFEPGLLRGTGAAAPGMITARLGGEDFAFLDLTDPAFDLSDRGVAGREAAGPMDAFLTTDRGAYRAGDTIHATALLRDARMAALAGVPLTAVLTRPDGVEYSRHLSDGAAAGGHHFAMPVGATAPRGTWRLSLYADPQAEPVASQTLLVEDFVSERIDVSLDLPEGAILRSAPPELRISARYLFGAPGADLPVDGEVRLEARREIAALRGFFFGRHDAERNVAVTSLPEGLRTDAEGTARLALPLADSASRDRPYELRATVRVREGSGRPVERSVTRQVAPLGSMIGIRPQFDAVLAEGSEARFDLQAFTPDLDPVAMPVHWTLNRVTTRYQWYALHGNWQWEPVTSRETVASGTVDLGPAPVTVAHPVDWGRYELVVERRDGTYIASSVDFRAGWFAPADASASPDILELSLDRAAYAPGETATLRVVPRAAGNAAITIMSNRLIGMRMAALAEGENTIRLPVTDDWRGGVYVAAQLVHPLANAEERAPTRSLGVAHAALDPGARKLDVTIDAPETARSRGPLETTVRIAGLDPDVSAHVTLAAVDLGILNLTGFEAPDPVGHYFGQRRLGVEIRDLYGRLIDGKSGTMGRLRSGGDASAHMRLQSPPPTEELVAQFSGIVTTDGEGRATVTFDIPPFNGTLRLMAVAWTADAVGQAARDVIIRDPVVLSASLPRFLAPGDRSRLLLELTHAEGPAGEMPLEVTAEGFELGQDAIPASVVLPESGSIRLSIPLVARTVGDFDLAVAVTTPAGERLVRELRFGVRANDPAISVTRRLSLAPGEALTLDDTVFTGFVRGSAEALVSAGPLARFDAPALLASLNRYPYGCTEQVTSQALPLLYMSSLAETLGYGNRAQIGAQVGRAIEVILSRQAANGGFGLWRAGSGDPWLDAYVTDFLSRARKTGQEVPARAFGQALDNLANRIAYAPDFDSGGEDLAYALMILAREGRAAMGDLRYYADVKADAFATPLAQAQLASALSAYGDQQRADRLFAKAAARLAGRLGAPENPVWRADYGSDLRDAAGLLALAVSARSEAVDRADLIAALGAAQGRLSTQEQSWALLAAHAITGDPAGSTLAVDGVPVPGAYMRRFDGQLPSQNIANTGTTPTDLTITTIGVPDRPAEAGGYGYAVTRELFDMQGQPLAGPVAVGDRMVAVLTVRPAETVGARLIVDDPLPAGLEIDNPNLLRSGDIRALDWLDPAETRHAEFRSDRFIAAVDWTGAEPFRLAYILRAVSPGRFHHPAVSVEDMYRPEFRARGATGSLTVVE